MKLLQTIGIAAALAISATSATQALAQSDSVAGKAETRAARKAEGMQATKDFHPGEGNPVPDARAKVPRAERAKAREARKPAGAAAAQSFKSGEGDPKPVAVAREPRAERRAERRAKRAEISAENKAGQLPTYGEGYGGAAK